MSGYNIVYWIKGPQGNLFFKNELVYGHEARGGGQIISSVTCRTRFRLIFEMHSARLAASLHNLLASKIFVFKKRSPCGPLQSVHFYYPIL